MLGWALYLYADSIRDKEHLQGRVPVQIKGIEVGSFVTKKWKFKLEKADLKAYLEELEKPLCFAPFGQVEFAPVGHNMIAPCKVLVQGSILFYPFRYSGFS